GGERDDRERLRRADHEGAPARVRRRDEPSDPAADGGVRRVIGAQRVDFIAVPVSDLARADEFYGQTLGLGRNPNNSGERWIEYETGNLTIALAQYGGGIGIRVEDVDAARRAAESEGLEF